jgi:hypothetical protein
LELRDESTPHPHANLPALDAHDGSPPKLDSEAAMDHTIAIGNRMFPSGAAVRFSGAIPPEVFPFIATMVRGRRRETLKNGGFRCSLTSGGAPIQRVSPPGA